MDEQELMRLVDKGDEAAFSRIVCAYKDKIVNFLYQFTGDYQKAVDLSQETFLRVYFKAGKYRPVAPLSSWIYTIASNLAKTEAKKTRKIATVSLEDVVNDYQARSYSIDQRDSGLVRNLREALDSLHPRYRVPVILKDMEGFSEEEFARVLKKPVGTVKALISRARTMLKKKLEKAVDGKAFSVLSQEK